MKGLDKKSNFFSCLFGLFMSEVPALFAKTVESCIFTISSLLHEVWKKRLQLLVFCHFSSLGLCLTTVLTQIFNKWDPSSQQQLTHQTHVCQAMSAPTAIWINSQKSSLILVVCVLVKQKCVHAEVYSASEGLRFSGRLAHCFSVEIHPTIPSFIGLCSQINSCLV